MATETWRAPTMPAHILFWAFAGKFPAMLADLRTHGYKVTEVALAHSSLPLFDVDVVLVDVTAMGFEFLSAVREISASMALCNPHGRLLCVSAASRNPRFVLGLEKCGARYVRIGNSALLIEAVELAVSEVRSIALTKPHFLIVHGFSQGSCAPGEAIGAVLADNGGQLAQLSLPLAQRFIFDFVAKNRGIAMDSLQITSGIRGGWFYRNHASNSGVRQTKRIRPATIKVLVQRIRDAMVRAGIRFDPCIVLRAIPAEGSKRVLYRLDAEVDWLHCAEDIQSTIREISRGVGTATKFTT